jgi:hypothetical protein
MDVENVDEYIQPETQDKINLLKLKLSARNKTVPKYLTTLKH